MSGTTSRRDRRARVLATLEAHGLSAAGAGALWRLGAELRDRTLRTKQEYAALVDAETGEPFGEVLAGASDEVEARPLLRTMRPHRRYAGVHTHPDGASFSPIDASLLVSYAPALCAIAAVGGQGVWYVLSPMPDSPVAAPVDIRTAFDQERDGLAPGYEQRVQAGELTRREAQRAYTHAVWERIATAVGLRYDRV